MRFFNRLKKKANDNELHIENINEIWEDAYEANPKVYEHLDGSIIIGFALTEDTDSLFPLSPENQWTIEEKEINLWLITIVSLTNPQGGIIGQIEYHEAMKRLQPYIIAVKDGWGLIRAMTHEELDGLFEGLPRKLI